MQKKMCFLFPGQGAQYVGMGRDFYNAFPEARQVFEEADDLMHIKLSDSIFHNSETELLQTKIAQPAIYVTCIALLRVFEKLFTSNTQPFACAGLSLGEYTALTAAKKLSFQDGLKLVARRGQAMHEACEQTKGAMSVILGLGDDTVEEIVRALQLPDELWCANFNCPGQVVISGTVRGIEKGLTACLAQGAKRAIALDVHGAFHSGLMRPAQEALYEPITATKIQKSDIKVATNVTGAFVEEVDEIKELLLKQVTSPVRWQKAVRTIDTAGCDLYVEIGCGKSLTAMNKRIGVQGRTVSLEKVEDCKNVEEVLAS